MNKHPLRRKKATIRDIKRIVPLIKDSFSLCEFLGKTEKEVLVAQTIHACKLNHEKGCGCFSFNNIYGGISDNATSYNSLVNDGLFIEGKYKSKPVIYPTKALVAKLDAFFA